MLLGVLVLNGAGTRAQSPPAPPQTLDPDSVFRSATELVVLQVAVTDQKQRFVSDLGQDDFGIYEEGRRQPIALFAASAAPLDLMVVMDTSGSMVGRLGLAKDAAIDLIKTLKPDDRGAAMFFNDRVEIARDLTSDRDELVAAVRRAQPGGRTALYESLYIALRELARVRAAENALRRQAIVLMTDGDDNMSRVTYDMLLEEARRAAVTIFTIMPVASADVRNVPTTREPSLTAFEMRSLAEESGGRAFLAVSFRDLSGVYRDIASELGQQYWLAYAPTAGSDGYRRVQVRVETRPELRARTRSGYYAPRPNSRAAAP